MLTLMNWFISDTSMVSNFSRGYRAATWAWLKASPGTMLFVSIGTLRVVDLEPCMHIMADPHGSCKNVSDFVMPYGWQSSGWAAECVILVKVLPTNALRGQVM